MNCDRLRLVIEKAHQEIQAHLLTRQPTRYSDNSRSKVLSSKDLTVSQLRQMVGYGVKTRGKKKWSGVVEGKSEVQCRQAWQ